MIKPVNYELRRIEIEAEYNFRRATLRFDRSLTSASKIAEQMWEIETSRELQSQLAWFASLGYKVRAK